MQISVLSSVSEALPGKRLVWIALDVIRATSTIVTYVAESGGHVFVTDSISYALEQKKSSPSSVLIGERGGLKIEGFDFDNSPTEIIANLGHINGRDAILTTTNGTKLLAKLQAITQTVLIGSFLNISSVLKKALQMVDAEKYDGIGIACAGKEGRLVGDDFYCAGMMVQKLRSCINAEVSLDDVANTALAWAESYGEVLTVLKKSESGQNILRYGKEKDIVFCSQLDLYDVVPLAHGNIITK
ncbi:2-phosphosulfolactate phosphatase [Coprothermobacter platensis]|uniref:2-phosphosulfolactate phosphatase n=1 Tax=Coprothermobacter platensis TaxID=108819 RepID=UPI000369E9F1|nr:2-phosphosulfolactate phosphatase [Coprothermobacter platensis]